MMRPMRFRFENFCIVQYDDSGEYLMRGKQKNAVHYDYNLLGIIFYFKSDLTMALIFFIIGNYITTIDIKAFLKRLLGHKLKVWVIDQVKDLG